MNAQPDAGSHWNHFLAGEIGGMFGTMVSHPLDTLKTRMQIEMIGSNIRLTHNTFTILRQIAITDGILNIYKGILPPFFGYGLSSCFVFGVNHITKNIWLKNVKSHRLSLSDIVICGGITGFFNTFLITPIERIKTWSQSHKIYSIETTKLLYKDMGFFNAYFCGIKCTFAFQILACSIYFPIYELSLKVLTLKQDKMSKKWYSDYQIGDISNNNKKNVSSMKIFLSGGIAGVTSWIVGYPFDTLKTRIQSGFYTGSITITLLKRHFAVSYYGLMPALYKAAAFHSCLFLMYERILEAVPVDNYNNII